MPEMWNEYQKTFDRASLVLCHAGFRFENVFKYARNDTVRTVITSGRL